MPDEDRIFSEEEIGQVLKRAVEIQGKQPRTPSYGLSMDELRQLAKDSGIDPSFVNAAAGELEADREAAKTNWWGGAPASTVVRSVEGKISAETWEELLATLRREFENTGTTEERGSTRQWMYSGADQQTGHLIATYRDGRTKLEVFRAIPTLPAPFVIATLVLSIASLPVILAALKFSGLPAIATFLVVVTSLVMTSRFAYTKANRKSKQKLKDTANQLARIASQAAGRASRGKETNTPSAETDNSRTAGRVEQLSLAEDEYGERQGTAERTRTRAD